MAIVIMTCGKICSGKTTYAEKLRKRLSAVILSVDEIMLTIFDSDAGDKHDEYVERIKNYLFNKSTKLIETGINVILDWGLWSKAERKYAKEFYKSRNIECEIHFINISDEEWKKRINMRNSMIISGKTSAYVVDEGLAEKVNALFEMPDRNEVDVWVSQ
ncbi:MAG: ATP-binding protein [Oscillospiraceae bacterium]|nr:ATP-binding protein [Oscillospiraceae bacterium]